MKLEIKKNMTLRKLVFHVVGRIAICKINIYLRFFILFMMLPIEIIEKELNNWQNMINKICNGDKNVRINEKRWYNI